MPLCSWLSQCEVNTHCCLISGCRVCVWKKAHIVSTSDSSQRSTGHLFLKLSDFKWLLTSDHPFHITQPVIMVNGPGSVADQIWADLYFWKGACLDARFKNTGLWVSRTDVCRAPKTPTMRSCVHLQSYRSSKQWLVKHGCLSCMTVVGVAHKQHSTQTRTSTKDNEAVWRTVGSKGMTLYAFNRGANMGSRQEIQIG